MSTMHNHKEILNWHRLGIITLAPIILGLFRDGFPVLFPFIQAEFNLSRAQIGLYSSFLFFSSSLISIFSGRTIDLIGSKRGMLYGVGLISFCTFLYSLSPTFLFLLLVCFVAGVGLSFVLPAASKGVMDWFDSTHQITAIGIIQSGMGFGGLIGAGFLPLLSTSFGWRQATFILWLFTLIASLLIYRSYREPIGTIETEPNFSFRSFVSAAYETFKKPKMQLLCAWGLTLGGVFGIINTHFTLFLHLDYKLSMSYTGFVFAMIRIGGIVGIPFWRLITERFFARKKEALLLIVCLITASTMFVFSFYKGNFLFLIFFLAFVFGNCSLSFFSLYTTIIGDYVEKKSIGTALGLTLLFVRLGMMFFPPFFGFLADCVGEYGLSWLILGVIVFSLSIVFYFFNIHLTRKQEV